MAKKYDFIIIGGGAIASSIVLDLSSRGYSTLLLEKNDFASNTSSKSTKLLHGGVRYLENAIKNFDLSQYKFVKEALGERKLALENAKHISKAMPILTPVYSYLDLFYYYIGLKMYDFISGSNSIGGSALLSYEETIKKIPNIKTKGLKGSVKYYDGSFVDFRMVISLLKTAQKFGAHVRNYHEVNSFIKENEKIVGVKVKDILKNEDREYYTDVVINATGSFVDKIRNLDDSSSKSLIKLSKGSHLVVSKKFLPNDSGMLIPKTEDGRVIFMLPWQKSCLIGTTDLSTKNCSCKKIDKSEIEYLLKHINKYLENKIEKSDIKSTFSGVRALVNDDELKTSDITREHKFEISKSGLISIAGGKWTTSRKIAQECVELFFENLKKDLKSACKTQNIKLEDEIIFNEEFLNDLEKNKKQIEEYILYSIKEEYVKRIEDFICRRVSIALRDKNLALELVSFIADTMKEYFSWSKEEYEKNIKTAKDSIEKEF